jgi:hypothetical protein
MGESRCSLVTNNEPTMVQPAFPLSRSIVTLILFVLGCFLPIASDAGSVESYGKLPLHFEANQGQAHHDVHFLSRGPGYSLYLTASEAVLALAAPSADSKSIAVRMRLVGAERKPVVSGLEELPGKANYFIGNDPAKWRTNLPTYAKVHYREVYPGIDLVYYGNQRSLEYDFVVAPGANPKKIVLGFKGADKLEIDAAGDLVLHKAGSVIHQKKPVIYQEVDGIRQEIDGRYVLKPGKRVGFQVAAYDKSRPLIIDPVLAYSTYLGGNANEIGVGIAVDAAGHAYVTGVTSSINFPTTAGAFDTSLDGGSDTFVTKLDPSGSSLVYSTYLGGSSSSEFEFAGGIAVDAAGNAYVSGQTDSADFPTTSGAFQTSRRGSLDAFVTKLNPTGSVLVYSTFLGGNRVSAGSGIAVDATGAAYVTGRTFSTDFPTTAGAFQRVHGGSFDAFVTKLDPSGSELIYSTYLGGSLFDDSSGIAVDATGAAYVTGGTGSTNFPTTAGAFQTSSAGGAFVTKLNATGTALVYSTFLGGPGVGTGIAVDAAGAAYVVGFTESTNFPTTAGAFDTSLNGGGDTFVTKLNAAGSALIYSTFLGGSGIDNGTGIAVDATGAAHVTGLTTSVDFPTTLGAFQPVFHGCKSSNPFPSADCDAYVTKLNPEGSALVYSSYLGGIGEDAGTGIAVDADGNAYVTGHTRSINFPRRVAIQHIFGGDRDAFVAKIVDRPAEPHRP